MSRIWLRSAESYASDASALLLLSMLVSSSATVGGESRPLIPQYGQLSAYPASNILIISDRASNLQRILGIIQHIDQAGDQDVELISLSNTSASDVVRIINTIYQGQASGEGGTTVKVVADEHSNSVLLSGDQRQRLRLRDLLAHLDTPSSSGGDTQVRYLHYLEAEKIAPKLKEQITGIAQAGSGASGAGSTPQAQADKAAMIWADPTNNALVITASPKLMRAVMDIIDKLDIRRPQVLVEAVIAEVDVDKTAELGVNWAAYGNKTTDVPLAGFVEPVGGTSIVDLYNTYNNPSNATTSTLQGTTLGIGRITSAGTSVLASLRAINGKSSTNVIATPKAITMDNQEAELKVAQEVPFITGQYTNSTASGGSGVNPFQTIQRQEVGTILKVTPTISADGKAVALKLSIESSSLGQKPAGAVDLVTNKRTISTKVLIENGGVVVLGGLLENNSVKGQQSVPFLGSIPLIGLAFKTRNASATKNNLMIFIRPTILLDDSQATAKADEAYRYMSEQARSQDQRELLPLLPGEKQPEIPLAPPSQAGIKAEASDQR